MISAVPTIALMVVITVVVGALTLPYAKRRETAYRSATAAVVDALQDYEKCIASSNGRDACADQFGDLELRKIVSKWW